MHERDEGCREGKGGRGREAEGERRGDDDDDDETVCSSFFFFESTSTSASAALFLIYALSPTVTLAFFSRVCCFQPRLPRILSCETSRVFCFASSTCHFSTRTGRGEVSTAPVEIRPAEGGGGAGDRRQDER